MFLSVDLPAPFSPTSITISPAPTVKPYVAQHRHAGKALIDSVQLKQVRIAACPLA